MKSRTELTTIARRHAEKVGAVVTISALELGAWVQVGDVIELPCPHGKESFMVSSRRVVITTDGAQELLIRLDFPARF